MQYKTKTFNLVHFLIEQCLALNLHKMDTFKKKKGKEKPGSWEQKQFRIYVRVCNMITPVILIEDKV